jgi:hypothetical protein
MGEEMEEARVPAVLVTHYHRAGSRLPCRYSYPAFFKEPPGNDSVRIIPHLPIC